METWKPVVGYNGSYSVSDLGNVRSEDRVIPHPYSVANRLPGRILKPFNNNMGYGMVTLCSPGEKKKFLVHVLVLEAFIGPRPLNYEACHNNGIPLDCRLENLRWDSRSNNHKDRIKHGTGMRGSKAPAAKLTEDAVKRIKADTRLQRIIAAEHLITQSQVSRIKLGLRWGHLEE